jgi:hypothetical protein
MKTSESDASPVQRQPASSPGDKVSRPAVRAADTPRDTLQAVADQSPRVQAQRKAMQTTFGDAIQRQPLTLGSSVLAPASTGGPVAQLQVASGLANAAALTGVTWQALLRTSAFRSYINGHEPDVTSGQGANNDTYLLVWTGAIQFNDGSLGDLHLHMHEGILDPDALAGGGAWVDGGAAGHGSNVGALRSVMQVCVDWINENYDSECTVG